MRRLFAIVVTFFGGAWAMLNIIGTFQTAKSLYDDRGIIANAAVFIITAPSPWVPLSVFAGGIVALIGLRAGWFDRTDGKSQSEPQDVFVAVDQLKDLFGEGRQMETDLQVRERSNPTIRAVLDWIERVNTCARQKALTGLIGPKDLKKFNDPWDPKDVLRIESLLEQHGYFEGVDDVGRLAFREIWGHVKRLEEMLAIIEGPAIQVLAAEPPLLPRLAIHVALDGFDELIIAGEEMKRRLRDNIEPIPTDLEIRDWGHRLIDLAASCATPSERNKLRNSLRQIQVGEMFDDTIPAPKEHWDRIDEVFGKMKVAKQIVARIFKEDEL